MILSIGEILADMIQEDLPSGEKVFAAHCGGAPFNVAANAKFCGATVGFIGRVGKDAIGDMLKESVKAFPLDFVDIQTDESRNTTLAFVTLFGGERKFSFYRKGTADYFIDAGALDFSAFENLNIVHLGSLMLSELSGRLLALKIADKVKNAGKLLSFDVNFRYDLFNSRQELCSAYKPFIEKADILKFGDDELLYYTGLDDISLAVKSLNLPQTLIAVSLGKDGSRVYYKNITAEIHTKSVKPIDTTGAGDAFFGALLSRLDKVSLSEISESQLIEYFEYANANGAQATQYKGALAHIKSC